MAESAKVRFQVSDRISDETGRAIRTWVAIKVGVTRTLATNDGAARVSKLKLTRAFID